MFSDIKRIRHLRLKMDDQPLTTPDLFASMQQQLQHAESQHHGRDHHPNRLPDRRQIYYKLSTLLFYQPSFIRPLGQLGQHGSEHQRRRLIILSRAHARTRARENVSFSTSLVCSSDRY